MNWIEKETDEYESFWHITSKENLESIKEKGITQSVIGINNDGVYCVKKNSYNALHSVIYFMEKNGIEKENQIIIEFEYLGEYYFNDIRPMYEESEWVCIKSDIPSEHIDKILGLDLEEVEA